jgi:LysM repeat protein
MKRIFENILIIIALTVGAQHVVMAQAYVNTPVSVSKEKVKINGELCYSHVVLEKQTLFSISKAYNVSVDEIYRLNPSLKETGLKKNAIILIPIAQDKTSEAPVQDNPIKVEQERQERQRQLDSLTAIEVQKPTKPVVKHIVHVRKWF